MNAVNIHNALNAADGAVRAQIELLGNHFVNAADGMQEVCMKCVSMCCDCVIVFFVIMIA